MSVPEILQLAQRFYATLADANGAAILATLDRDLHAEITAGLPEGWGGVYDGGLELLERCWRPMFAKIEVRPDPHRYLPCVPDIVVVQREYQICNRPAGSRQTAAFIHILEFTGGRIRRLVQVTDSARWHEALAADLSGSH